MTDDTKERKEKMVAEANERMKGKPTPTQEENDRAKLGEHIAQHEDDGSGPDPGLVTRQSEAKPAGAQAGYQTRATQPRRAE